MLGRNRTSRASMVGFGVALALTTAAVATVVLATDRQQQASSDTSRDGAPWMSADPSPQVEGLSRLDRASVGPDGFVFGRLRILPTGGVPRESSISNYMKDRTRPGEEYRRHLPGDPLPSGLLRIPSNPRWTAVQDVSESAVDGNGNIRIIEEGALIRPSGSNHDWILASGAIKPGAFLEEVFQERDGATFLYRKAGLNAVVVDASPSLAFDRVWHVSWVSGDRWFQLVAPVAAFEDVALFLDALTDANR